MTLHLLIDDLTKELNLTPEQQFRLTAKIKRLIHHEKADVYQRIALYSEGPGGEVLDQFIHETAQGKADSHLLWAEKSDEEIVTWDVGSHQFNQEKPPCQDCGKNLTPRGTAYLHTFSFPDGHAFYCQPCADKRGIWDEEEE